MPLKKYQWVLIFLLLIIYCFAFQGVRSLFDPDEGRYSAVAMQMIKSGDWLNPRTHPDHEHWTKPPLAYWAIARSLLLFGTNEFAVRFPNALSFLITIIASFFLGKIFVPSRPWIVSLIFGTCLFPATMCNGATTDYILMMFETIAVCFFSYAFWGKNNKTKKISTWLMWVSFGLAFLTKGPPALLPLLSIIIFLQFKPVKSCKANLFLPGGLLLMLTIGGSWFFAVIVQNAELIQYFLWDEVVLRVFTSHHQRHSKWYAALYIFVPVLVFGMFPWCYYTAKGLIRSVKEAKRKEGLADEDYLKSLFLLLWIGIPLGIFIVSKSKLPLYVLPTFVPLAIITARQMERLTFSFDRFRYYVILWCVFIVGVRLIMASINFKQDAFKFAQHIKEMHPHHVEEIVFVNTIPAFGLHFYTGADIEEVSFEYADITKEFKENKSRLWFTLEEEADQFMEEMKMHNIPMKKLGPITARKNYVLFRRITGTI